MRPEQPKPYDFQQAAEEAAKLQELAGERATKEEYDLAEFLLEEEYAARAAARETNPGPESAEVLEAEAAVDRLVADMKAEAETAKEKIIGEPRIRKEYEAMLPRHSMPSKAKREEMAAKNLKIETWLVFTGGDRDPAEVMVDEAIGEIVQRGYEVVRDKFGRDPAAREAHYGKLDSVLGQLAARHHPELFDIGSKDMKALAKRDPELYRKVRDTPCEVRFMIAVKETVLPPVAPRQQAETASAETPQEAAVEAGPAVTFELPAILPTKSELEEGIDDLVSLPEPSKIDWSKLERPQGDEALTKSIQEGKPLADRIAAAEGRMGHPASELRVLMARMASAHRTGEWSDSLVEDYVRLMDGLPQYIHHRLAYYELLQRVEKGEVRMPETMLSTASGPHEEARAQQDLDAWAKEIGVKAPKIFNLDLNGRMLSVGARAFQERYGFPSPTLDVRGSAFTLPYKDGAFDLSECSSLDSFSDPTDVYLVLSEMVRTTKPDGLLRLVVRRELDEAFFGALERDLGLRFLTLPHTRLVVPASLDAQLRKAGGDAFAERMRRKVGKAEYVLAARTDRPVKTLGAEAHREIFEDVKRELGADPDPAEQSGAILEKLRRRARELVDVAQYSVQKKDDAVFVAPTNLAEAAAAITTTETRPETSEEVPRGKEEALVEAAPVASAERPPVVETAQSVPVEVEPEIDEQAIKDIEATLLGYDPKLPGRRDSGMLKGAVRTLAESLLAEARKDVRTVAERELAEFTANLTLGQQIAVKRLPRKTRIVLLKRFDPKLAAELFKRGVIRIEE